MIRVFLAYILFALSAVTTMAADYPSCSNMRDGPICETSFNGFYYIGYSSENTFAGQLGSGTRSIARGLSVVEVETGTVNQIVSFAAASGEVAEDGSGNNSPYATALIELLDEPNLEVGKMFRLLGERVSEMTGGKQQPVKRDNLRGEDIFLVVE